MEGDDGDHGLDDGGDVLEDELVEDGKDSVPDDFFEVKDTEGLEHGGHGFGDVHVQQEGDDEPDETTRCQLVHAVLEGVEGIGFEETESRIHSETNVDDESKDGGEEVAEEEFNGVLGDTDLGHDDGDDTGEDGTDERTDETTGLETVDAFVFRVGIVRFPDFRVFEGFEEVSDKTKDNGH